MSESSFHDVLNAIHPVDIACLGFIVWQSVAGAIRGFAFQFVRVLTWAGGLVLARQYAPRVADVITSFGTGMSAASASIVAWFVLVFGTLLAGLLVLRLVRTVIASWKLGGLDRTLGFVFGLAKAALIVVVAMILAFAIGRPLGFDEFLARSKAAEWSGEILAKTAPALPSDLGAQFHEWIATAKARIATAAPPAEDSEGVTAPK